MAGRGSFVSIALACTSVTVTFSGQRDVLNEKEIETVYSVLQAMVDNVEQDIHLDRKYYAGRLFTKYINLNEKGVVIRLTRWSSECSVSMPLSDTNKGRYLLEAFKQLLPTIRPYLLGKGSEWGAVSKHTDWIDYHVREEEVSPWFAGYMIILEGPNNNRNECVIKSSMSLSSLSRR